MRAGSLTQELYNHVLQFRGTERSPEYERLHIRGDQLVTNLGQIEECLTRDALRRPLFPYLEACLSLVNARLQKVLRLLTKMGHNQVYGLSDLRIRGLYIGPDTARHLLDHQGDRRESARRELGRLEAEREAARRVQDLHEGEEAEYEEVSVAQRVHHYDHIRVHHYDGIADVSSTQLQGGSGRPDVTQDVGPEKVQGQGGRVGDVGGDDEVSGVSEGDRGGQADGVHLVEEADPVGDQGVRADGVQLAEEVDPVGGRADGVQMAEEVDPEGAAGGRAAGVQLVEDVDPEGDAGGRAAGVQLVEDVDPEGDAGGLSSYRPTGSDHVGDEVHPEREEDAGGWCTVKSKKKRGKVTFSPSAVQKPPGRVYTRRSPRHK